MRPGYIESKDAIQKRLRRVEGQVRGLQRMVEEDRYCIDILEQVSAATKALQAVALELLDDHLAHCVSDAVHQGGTKRPRSSTRPPRPSAGSFAPDSDGCNGHRAGGHRPIAAGGLLHVLGDPLASRAGVRPGRSGAGLREPRRPCGSGSATTGPRPSCGPRGTGWCHPRAPTRRPPWRSRSS